MKKVLLVSVGTVGEVTLQTLGASLAKRLGSPCTISPDRLHPNFAFQAARNQYHSTEILARLSTLVNDEAYRVLGITEVDLFIPIFTFVFGEAQLEGGCALVSLYRLREEFYGLPPRPLLVQERLTKEALHELGHTFGLRHCPDYRCVMRHSHSVAAIDVKEAEICRDCAKIIPIPLAPSGLSMANC